MIYGISGLPAPSGLYATVINTACMNATTNFPPCVAYAVANRETIRGERAGLWVAKSVVSDDGGHGLFQLTSSYPPDWDDPMANTLYALANFLLPALHYFAGAGHSGDDLIDLVADAFNAGTGRVDSYLRQGLKPDAATTGGDYGTDVLHNYRLLAQGQPAQ